MLPWDVYTCVLSVTCFVAIPNCSLGSIIWNKLSGESQAILQPFLSSQYNAEGRPKNKISIPIHRSGRKFIFKDWISKFTMVLIKKVCAGWMGEWLIFGTMLTLSCTCCFCLQVQHERAARIFNACVYQFNHSLQIILFLFPHVLCSVITQDRDTGSKDPDLAHEVGGWWGCCVDEEGDVAWVGMCDG